MQQIVCFCFDFNNTRKRMGSSICFPLRWMQRFIITDDLWLVMIFTIWRPSTVKKAPLLYDKDLKDRSKISCRKYLYWTTAISLKRVFESSKILNQAKHCRAWRKREKQKTISKIQPDGEVLEDSKACIFNEIFIDAIKILLNSDMGLCSRSTWLCFFFV